MLESMTEDRDHTSFIKGLYQNILGREADEPGLRFEKCTSRGPT